MRAAAPSITPPASLLRCWMMRPQRLRDRLVVGHDHQRRLRRAIQLEQQLDDALAGHRVEIAGRLVREQHGRPRHERACNGDTLLLAARQLSRIVLAARREIDLREHFGRRAARIRQAGQLQRQHHVLDRRQRRDQVKALKDEADMPRAHGCTAVLVERRQLGAVEPDPPGARLVEPGEQRQQAWICRRRTRRRWRRFLRRRSAGRLLPEWSAFLPGC